MADITIRQFVGMLGELTAASTSDDAYVSDCAFAANTTSLHIAHIRGWLEDQDERFPDTPLDRRTAARIIHNFMRIEFSIPDLPDITPATRLADLYTCHACVNHVAQVFCRGIMSSTETERDGKIYEIFDMLAQISESEANEFLSKIKEIHLSSL